MKKNKLLMKMPHCPQNLEETVWIGANGSQEDTFLRKHPKNNQKPKTHGKTKKTTN